MEQDVSIFRIAKGTSAGGLRREDSEVESVGQIEVFDLLRTERMAGNDAFFAVGEVAKLLKERHKTNGSYDSTRRALMRLSLSGYLDVKMSGKLTDWKRLYRCKQKYIDILKQE